MMQGVVNAELEVTIEIQVIGSSGHLVLEAVIDTGYNGALALRPGTILALNLTRLMPGNVWFADGSQQVLDFFQADVIWNGQRRTVRVLCVPDDTLVGTGLLEGYRMTADFRDGGNVTITILP
jgi:clan AA aspartic protease